MTAGGTLLETRDSRHEAWEAAIASVATARALGWKIEVSVRRVRLARGSTWGVFLLSTGKSGA